ncbi:hypothetical protein ARAF_2616 [Arsenophonus endosymbiont of Aleurodicus floccissimus]|nr:hypothetical protein ARAF_2616 [Arsenophonus endosymbiont of Aleurodicus floccissimus]
MIRKIGALKDDELISCKQKPVVYIKYIFISIILYLNGKKYFISTFFLKNKHKYIEISLKIFNKLFY